MFGRMTRIAALATMLTHMWVSIVVAPLHHMVEHRLAVSEPDSKTDATLSANNCRCQHRAHRTKTVPTCDIPLSEAANSSDGEPTPTTPHNHDACQICQVLAQQFTTLELPRPVVALEQVEFSPPVSAVQPMLGSLIDPVSRGPPAV